MTDWDHIKAEKFAPESPPGWPKGVKGISNEGLSLLGIHEKTSALYWDGDEIVTKRTVELNLFERILAFIVTAATAGTFILELGRSNYWWD